MMFEFKTPDLANIGESDTENGLVKKYTRILACVRGDEPDAHTAWLVVDNQQFCITPLACDDSNAATWHCLMLARALEKILSK